MDRKTFYAIEGTDYKEMAIQILKAARVSEEIGDKKKRIGVKPNILGTLKPSQGATTHPELVDGVLTYLEECGFFHVEVLEGAWIGDQTVKAAKYTGVYDVCQMHHVPFVDLQKDTSRMCDAKGMKLSVCEEALKLDYLINIPVIKGHCQTTVTCALKNSKGLIPNSEKRRFHTMGLHAPIAHLNTVIHQDFILVDNICGDLDFEEGGNPVVMNRVLGFRDPVLCDSFAAECMGYHPRDIEYIRLAEKLGVGCTDVSSAKMLSLNESVMRNNEAGVGEEDGTGVGKEAGTVVGRGNRTNIGKDGGMVVGRGDRTGIGKAGGIGIGSKVAGFDAKLFGADKMQVSRQVTRLAAYTSPKDACSACYGSLIHALARLEERGGLYGKGKESIAIGQGYAGQTGKIGVGKCTKCFEKNLMGCPPKAVDIVKFLEKEWK